MQFPSTLKRKLEACVIKAMNPFILQAFTSDYEQEFKITFQNAVVGITSGFEEQVNAYIDRLIGNETIHQFIDRYRTDARTKDLSYVKTFLEEYDLLFEKQGDNVNLASNIFNQVIVNKNSAFLARNDVRAALYTLSKGEKSNLIINGNSKSGLSYMAYYFSEMALQVECFDFHYLDLKKIKPFYAKEKQVENGIEVEKQIQFSNIHLAQAILDDLLIKDFKIDPKEFKHMEFVSHLRDYFKEKKLPTLFYVDQFDLTEASNVFALVDDMVADFNLHNIKCNIILGGNYNIEGWTKPLRRNTPKIELESGSFSKEDVKEFFSGVYKYLRRKGLDLTVSEADFIKIYCCLIAEDFYKPEEKDKNVEPIGDTLSDWYVDFTNKLQKNNPLSN